MNVVIDASVLIKFYVPEILSDRAERVLADVEEGHIDLSAPDLIYPEAGNILWKKERLKELTRPEVGEITSAILSLPLKVEDSRSLMSLALEIAIVYRITVYDAIYVGLTRVFETRLITADRKLVEVLAKTDLEDSMIWLGSYK